MRLDLRTQMQSIHRRQDRGKQKASFNIQKQNKYKKQRELDTKASQNDKKAK